MTDLLDDYMKYMSTTECTPQNVRWTFIGLVAAAIGRGIEIPFGHLPMYPNMYIFLTGLPATRKSFAITIGKNLLFRSGYDHFAFDKTTREKFLLDFELGFCQNNYSNSADDFTNLLNSSTTKDSNYISECFICVDEFVDFIGLKNFNFLNLFTTLYDNKSNYPERLKNSKSVNIINPTVNILGGLTPSSLAMVLPQEMVGQGFTSRIIIVHSGTVPRKITFPKPPDKQLEAKIVDGLSRIRNMHGVINYTPQAYNLLDEIYQKYIPLADGRLQHYCSRRFTHLLKLCAIFASIQETLQVDDIIVERANTILSYTEASMHLGLGEFGDARHAKGTQRVMEILTDASEPLNLQQLWSAVSSDFDRIRDLNEIINNLENAKKIIVNHDNGFIILNRDQRTRNLLGINYEKHIPEFSALPEDF